MAIPKVTIVVVPRERFSAARRSLETLFANTNHPFSLVYVDAGSPKPLRRYLEAEAERRNFQLVRTENFLSPNQARNLGLSHVHTEAVVFLDNDVLVAPGWLAALVDCLETTGAAVVAPLYLMNEGPRQVIHMAGGVSRIQETNGQRLLFEQDQLAGQRLPEVRDKLQRAPCDLVEFHCLLVRKEILDSLGGFDEQLTAMREQDDFCLAVRAAGGVIYLEPQSVVTFLPPPPIAWSDRPFFMYRWDRKRLKDSLDHFHRKWRLDMDATHPHYDWLWGRPGLFVHQYTKPLRPLRNLVRRVLGQKAR